MENRINIVLWYNGLWQEKLVIFAQVLELKCTFAELI